MGTSSNKMGRVQQAMFDYERVMLFFVHRINEHPLTMDMI